MHQPKEFAHSLVGESFSKYYTVDGKQIATLGALQGGQTIKIGKYRKTHKSARANISECFEYWVLIRGSLYIFSDQLYFICNNIFLTLKYFFGTCPEHVNQMPKKCITVVCKSYETYIYIYIYIRCMQHAFYLDIQYGIMSYHMVSYDII